MSEAAVLLGATLEEEKPTDEKLTELAQSEINVAAEEGGEEDKDERPCRKSGSRS